MNKKTIGILAAVVALFGGLVVYQVSATEAITENESVKAELHQTVFLGDDQGSVNEVVKGDVVCFNSKKCVVKGEVDGDVIVASLDVEIDAKVSGSVRVAARKLTFSEGTEVAGNVTVYGYETNIGAGVKMLRDVFIFGSEVKIDGEIGRDLNVAADDFQLNGQVGRNARVESEKVTVADSAKIDGDFEHVSAEYQIGDGVVTGQTTHEELKTKTKRDNNQINDALIWTSGVGLMILAMLAFRPTRLTEFAKQEFKLINIFLVAIGFGAVVLLPILAIFIMVTVIGVPLAFVILAAWVVICLMALPVGVYYVITNSYAIIDKQSKFSLFVGLVIYGILTQVPVVGWMMNTVLFGLGAGIIVKMITSSSAKKESKIAK